MRVSAGALLAACSAAQTAAFVVQRRSTHGTINTSSDFTEKMCAPRSSLHQSEGDNDSEWLQSTLGSLSLEEETRRAEENLKSWGKMLELLGEATEDDMGNERSMYKLNDAPSTSTSLKASPRQEPESRYSPPKTRLQTPRASAQSPSALQASSGPNSSNNTPNSKAAPPRRSAPKAGASGGASASSPPNGRPSSIPNGQARRPNGVPFYASAGATSPSTANRPSSTSTAVLEPPIPGSYSMSPEETPQVRKATPTLNASPLNAIEESRFAARRRINQPANVMPDPTTLEVMPPSRMVSKPVRAKSPSNIVRQTPWEEGDTRWEEGLDYITGDQVPQPLARRKRRARSSNFKKDTVIVQGGALKTWTYLTPGIERVQVEMYTEGRPLDADIELWRGPDNTPHKIRVYIEDGSDRPFRAIIETPGSGNTVAVRNVAQVEFPLEASLSTKVDITPMSFEAPRPLQGGAIRSFPFDPYVESVAVELATDGRPLNARLELLQGPNNNKQVVEVYTEDGLERPFHIILATPGAGNVLRVVNTASMEFPFSASVGIHSTATPDDDYGDVVIGGDNFGGGFMAGVSQW